MPANAQTIAAIINEKTIAGPEYCAATVPGSMNIPVPTMAPTPSSTKSNAPNVCLSCTSSFF